MSNDQLGIVFRQLAAEYEVLSFHGLGIIIRCLEFHLTSTGKHSESLLKLLDLQCTSGGLKLKVIFKLNVLSTHLIKNSCDRYVMQ